MTTRAISLAASAIVKHVANGGWIGASFPTYLKACRRLKGGRWQYERAYNLAFDRFHCRYGRFMDVAMRANLEDGDNR
jgi:hypothetical protein